MISAIAMILVAAATELRRELGAAAGHAARGTHPAAGQPARVRSRAHARAAGGLPRAGPSARRVVSRQRAQYLSVLRRYHDWLDSLPENRQDELAAKPPGERMALVRKLITRASGADGDTPPILRVLEPGEYYPFEVASAYRIWKVLAEKQQAADRASRTGDGRREAALHDGARSKNAIPRETMPADFDEEKWIGLAEDLLART